MEHEGSLPRVQKPHLSLSWARVTQYRSPHSTSWESILMLSSHLRLGLPICTFPSGFGIKTLFAPLLSLIHATRHTHLILLNFITRTVLCEQYRSFSSSLCSFLHSPVTSSLLGPNIHLNTLFSNTLSLRSSLSISDQVSHPYKTTGRIILLCILIFKFLDSKLKTEDSALQFCMLQCRKSWEGQLSPPDTASPHLLSEEVSAVSFLAAHNWALVKFCARYLKVTSQVAGVDLMY